MNIREYKLLLVQKKTKKWFDAKFLFVWNKKKKVSVKIKKLIRKNTDKQKKKNIWNAFLFVHTFVQLRIKYNV